MSKHNDLQRECFLWAWNYKPQIRGKIWGISQNALGGRQGSVLKGLGFNKGVWDMLIAGRFDNIWIEFKIPPDDLSKEQVEFMNCVRGQYFIVKTLDEFKKVVIQHVL